MNKCLRHIKIAHEILDYGDGGLGESYGMKTWRTMWEDGYCNGECIECKSKFICYTMGKNEILVVDNRNKVSVDLSVEGYLN